jgi:hypothetical protein
MRAILRLNYVDYVLTTEEATRILDVLDKSERYESKYRSSGSYTHHVWEEVKPETIGLTLIPDHLYRVAKLAGKPEGN